MVGGGGRGQRGEGGSRVLRGVFAGGSQRSDGSDRRRASVGFGQAHAHLQNPLRVGNSFQGAFRRREPIGRDQRGRRRRGIHHREGGRGDEHLREGHLRLGAIHRAGTVGEGEHQGLRGRGVGREEGFGEGRVSGVSGGVQGSDVPRGLSAERKAQVRLLCHRLPRHPPRYGQEDRGQVRPPQGPAPQRRRRHLRRGTHSLDPPPLLHLPPHRLLRGT
mmetsp:Transcript_9089/g.16406  ORF Transcript_9089/g.16406 Transcript_9089/m.16406 type:complete len:218 (+) Transcript_9089:1191-1844(+)